MRRRAWGFGHGFGNFSNVVAYAAAVVHIVCVADGEFLDKIGDSARVTAHVAGEDWINMLEAPATFSETHGEEV